MKPRIFIVLPFLLCVAFAVPEGLWAQSVGGAEPAKPSVSELVAQGQLENMRKKSAELAKFHANFLKLSEIEKETLRKNSVAEIAFEDVFRMLNLQNAELTIELKGLLARHELLKTEAEKSTLEASQSDEVSNTQRDLLQRYVASQTTRLEMVKKLYEKGAQSREEVVTAEGLLLASKLRLEEFDAKKTTASPSLVKAMFETSLEIADKQARLSSVRKMLANYTKSKPAFFKLQDINRTLEWSEERMSELRLDMWAWENLGTEF